VKAILITRDGFVSNMNLPDGAQIYMPLYVPRHRRLVEGTGADGVLVQDVEYYYVSTTRNNVAIYEEY
jgi:hypothetical protein